MSRMFEKVSGNIFSAILISFLLVTLQASAEYYVMGITDKIADVPAIIADREGFWQEEGIDIRVSFVADKELLFNTMSFRINQTGRHCIDFWTCSAGELGYLRSEGYDVAGIAKIGNNIEFKDNEYPLVVPEVYNNTDMHSQLLCTKRWLAEKEPLLIKKFIQGYTKAQAWVSNPRNWAALAEILNETYYWIEYDSTLGPIDVEAIRNKFQAYQSCKPSEIDQHLHKEISRAEVAFQEHTRDIHDGLIKSDDAALNFKKTSTAFDTAIYWWRFAAKNDYRNYGTAGSAFDLSAKGSEQNMNLYGVRSSDYFNRKPIASAGGFLNDGYGWASDGVKKYLSTDKALKLTNNMTIWLRSINRNTKSTLLAAYGNYEGNNGFSIKYNAGEKPSFIFTLNNNPKAVLELKCPPQTFLDLSFVCDAQEGIIKGRLLETSTGRLINTDTIKVMSGFLKHYEQIITIGETSDPAINLPLHGNIESLAIWNQVLTEKQITELTRGPSENTSQKETINWHNVKDFGAVGDGIKDDTAAIQNAIEACVMPITLFDQKIGRWQPDTDAPQEPKPGFAYSGVVYIPFGIYKTTQPVILRPGVSLIGDVSMNPIISSDSDAAAVWWTGPWRDREIDFKARPDQLQNGCTNVTLKNITFRGKRFGAHTMGCAANRLRMQNCRLEGNEAGLVVTGFMMFSEIRDSQFESLWIIPQQGTRFNTTILENILVGIHGSRRENWAIRMEGCIQCVRLSEVTFEFRGKGLFLDANRSGLSIDINNIWNYDTGGPSEVLRIANGNGITVRNIMGLDHPSTIFVGKNVRNLRMENILAKSVTIEDANAVKPVFSNVATVKQNDHQSMIEDDMGAAKKSSH